MKNLNFEEVAMAVSADRSAPFWGEVLAARPMNINGIDVPSWRWTLILTKRDVSLYSKGIKPHARWKITDVKKYFGLKGNAEQLVILLDFIQRNLNLAEDVKQ